MQEIIDLFGNTRIQTEKGIMSERAALIKYFCEKVKKPPQQIGVRLAHFTVDYLYVIQSGYKDRENRQSKETADKWFWWISKTTKE